MIPRADKFFRSVNRANLYPGRVTDEMVRLAIRSLAVLLESRHETYDQATSNLLVAMADYAREHAPSLQETETVVKIIPSQSRDAI